MADKLELTWVEKKKNFELEPRILIEDIKNSYGDTDTENMVIHGDNLLALKALENKFANKIKCIYIDPPYNTGSAFFLISSKFLANTKIWFVFNDIIASFETDFLEFHVISYIKLFLPNISSQII